MSIELVETINQQAAGLTPREKSQLGRYFLEQATLDQGLRPVTAPQHETEVQRLRQLEWLKAHREEYAGQYVALEGDRLIATGKNFPEAARAAKAAGVPEAFVTFIYPPDYVGEVGGWT
jgi:hypothetical protein